MPERDRCADGMEDHRVGQLVAVHDTVMLQICTSPMQRASLNVSYFVACKPLAEKLIISSPLQEPTARKEASLFEAASFPGTPTLTFYKRL